MVIVEDVNEYAPVFKSVNAGLLPRSAERRHERIRDPAGAGGRRQHQRTGDTLVGVLRRNTPNSSDDRLADFGRELAARKDDGRDVLPAERDAGDGRSRPSSTQIDGLFICRPRKLCAQESRPHRVLRSVLQALQGLGAGIQEDEKGQS